VAQTAYASEQAQRQIALQERDKARDYAEELRHELYASGIEKIQRILATDGIDPVKPLLAECDTELRGWEWDRLSFLADRSMGTVQAASAQIYDLHFSGDGSVFATAGADLVPRLWDTETLKLVVEFKDAEAPNQSRATLSKDGKVVVTSDGKSFGVWDARTGLLQRSFPLKRPSLHNLALDATASRLAVAHWDGGFTVHDITTGALLLDGGEKTSSGRTVAFSQDGKLVLSASMGNDISMNSAVDGRQLWAKRGAGFVLLNAAFSPDEKFVATVGQDSRLWLRTADTGELVYTVATGKGASQAVAFHPDGTIIAVGGIDGLVSFFRASNGEKLYSLHGHEVEVSGIAFEPSGRFLISTGRDGSVKKWHLGAGGPQVRLGHTHVIGSLAFSADDLRLWAIGGAWKDLQLIDVAALKRLPIDCPVNQPKQLAVSPDGNRLAIVGDDQHGSCCILLTDKLQALHRWPLPYSTHASIDFSPDGRWLVVAPHSGELFLFDTRSGQTVWSSGEGRTDVLIINPVSFSRDGKYVLNGSREGMMRVLEAASGQLVREFHVAQEPVGPLALDLPGDRLFCGGIGKIDVWDWRTGEPIMTMTGHAGYVSKLALLPDGRRLISAGADATVRLWDTSSGRQVMVIGRHDGPVATIAVSHDGATIATGGYDNSLRLWETREPPLEGLDARLERARPTWVGYRSDD
jgi:WD40 repeat protein